MKEKRYAFIGGGNMARSLIGGLVNDGCDPAQIWVSDPSSEQRQQLAATFGVHTETANLQAVRQADVVILAVKPQVIEAVATEIAEAVQQQQCLVVSIAAGIRSADLERWLGGHCAVIRTMPNTPSLVGSGATALFANQTATAAQRDLAEFIMRAVGLTLWLDDEPLMDAVTALSGSGPAYFFLLMEALENAGCNAGLPRETARLLTLQTAFGAAKMALESSDDSATLRKCVTSPGGTTERAIKIMEAGEYQALINNAVQGAKERAQELADILGNHNHG